MYTHLNAPSICVSTDGIATHDCKMVGYQRPWRPALEALQEKLKPLSSWFGASTERWP